MMKALINIKILKIASFKMIAALIYYIKCPKMKVITKNLNKILNN